MTVAGDALLLFGGEGSYRTNTLFRLPLDYESKWQALTPPAAARIPAVAGHTATLVGSSLCIFGGETVTTDALGVSVRSLLNTTYALHLPSWTWSAAPTPGQPPP